MISLIISASLLSGCIHKPVIFQIPQIEVPKPTPLPAVNFIREKDRICVNKDNAQLLWYREQIILRENSELRELINAINTEFGIDE